MAFKVGDVVKLRSDGPDMTVCSGTEKSTLIHVRWFDGKREQSTTLPVEALVLVKGSGENA